MWPTSNNLATITIVSSYLNGSYKSIRGGSRISRWGGGDANPRWRGRQPPTQAFSVKTYVKMKEFGPVGGGARRKLLYVDLPLSI